MSNYRRLHPPPAPPRRWETIVIGAALWAIAFAPLATIFVAYSRMPACPALPFGG